MAEDFVSGVVVGGLAVGYLAYRFGTWMAAVRTARRSYRNVLGRHR